MVLLLRSPSLPEHGDVDTGIMQVNYTLNLPLLAGGLGGQLID